MLESLKQHWPEYLMEAGGLGAFMIAACALGVLLEHPGSPVRAAIGTAHLRRALMGVAMGVTAIAIIYSPWGKQSGAHLNPSVTFTFWRLGKIATPDVFFYVFAQFAGGAVGVLIASATLGALLEHPSVHHVTTEPGASGVAIAFAAEFVISLILMSAVLAASNIQPLAHFTGLIAGALVATYIFLEAPLSGMSMNPARTLGSALSAGRWTALWIYFTAPPLGMLAAAEIYLGRRGAHRVLCAKLHHENNKRCIFRCGYAEMERLHQSISIKEISNATT